MCFGYVIAWHFDTDNEEFFFVKLIFTGILRPCDQYPSEPGVLRANRPLSGVSNLSNGGVFIGNLQEKSEVDQSEMEVESTRFNKVI